MVLEEEVEFAMVDATKVVEGIPMLPPHLPATVNNQKVINGYDPKLGMRAARMTRKAHNT